ncbi:unnamed protein product, partial [Mycena citricolor]
YIESCERLCLRHNLAISRSTTYIPVKGQKAIECEYPRSTTRQSTRLEGVCLSLLDTRLCACPYTPRTVSVEHILNLDSVLGSDFAVRVGDARPRRWRSVATRQPALIQVSRAQFHEPRGTQLSQSA